MQPDFTPDELSYIESAVAEYEDGTYGDISSWTASDIITCELEGDTRDEFGSRGDAIAAEVARRVIAARG